MRGGSIVERYRFKHPWRGEVYEADVIVSEVSEWVQSPESKDSAWRAHLPAPTDRVPRVIAHRLTIPISIVDVAAARVDVVAPPH